MARLSRIRITASSPWMLGMIDTRKSISRPPDSTRKLPSCGMRRSEISSSASTFRREITCSATSMPLTEVA